MARIPFPDPQSLSPQTQRALSSPPDLGVFRLVSLADDAFPKFIALTGGLWADAELSPRRRELVILLVARLLNCEYEWFQHVEVAEICESSDAVIAAIEALELANFDDDEPEKIEFLGAKFKKWCIKFPYQVSSCLLSYLNKQNGGRAGAAVASGRVFCSSC